MARSLLVFKRQPSPFTSTSVIRPLFHQLCLGFGPGDDSRTHPWLQGEGDHWKNWGNDISAAEFSTLFTAATTGSAISAGLTEDNAVSVADAIFSFGGGHTEDHKMLAQLSNVLLNPAVSEESPNIGTMTASAVSARLTWTSFRAEDLMGRLSPDLIISEVTVGDLVNAAEYAWSGDLVDEFGDPSKETWTIDAAVLPGGVSLTENQKTILSKALEGINQGWYLNPNLDSYNNPIEYPDGPTCLNGTTLPDGIVGVNYGPYQLDVSGGSGCYL